MPDGGQIDAKVEARDSVRLFLGAGKRPDDVEQLLFGKPDQRAAQQRAERQRVATVGENTGECDQILDFLPAEKALAGLRGHRDAPALQRFLIAPQLRAGRRQQGDVTRLARTLRAAASVDNELAADQPRAQLGDRVGFGVALLLGAGLAVFIRHGNVDGGDTQASLRSS